MSEQNTPEVATDPISGGSASLAEWISKQEKLNEHLHALVAQQGKLIDRLYEHLNLPSQ